MKQQDVLDYVLLPEHGCYTYKTKNKEFGTQYFIRRKDGDKRKIAVIYPVKNDESYTTGAVCHICNLLEITVHDYGKTMQEQIDDAKAAVEKINNEEKKFKKDKDSGEDKC